MKNAGGGMRLVGLPTEACHGGVVAWFGLREPARQPTQEVVTT